MYSKTSVKHSTPFGQWFYYYHIVLLLPFVFSLIVLKCSVAYACLICEWTTSALSNISKSQYGFCGFNQLTVCMCVQLKENHRENQSNCGLDDLTNKFVKWNNCFMFWLGIKALKPSFTYRTRLEWMFDTS